jgi:hypothetical protein
MASLQPHGVQMVAELPLLRFVHHSARIDFSLLKVSIPDEAAGAEGFRGTIFEDQLIRMPEKIAALVLSKLGLNKRIFARNCQIGELTSGEAAEFLDRYHLLNAVPAAYSRCLRYHNEIIAVACFSKGRKMRRLPEDKRSFELMRFCCAHGITVAGGLSKLVRSFCREKGAGDIMSYVDKQLSDGASFIKAGFKIAGESTPNYFLVNRKTFERIAVSQDVDFDAEEFYMTANAGNVKMVFTPEE